MNWFRNLNAMPKLMLSFGLILAFTAGTGLLGVYRLGEQTAQYDLLFQRDVAGLVAVKEFEVAKASIAKTSRNSIIASTRSDYKLKVQEDEKQFDGYMDRLRRLSKSMSANVYQPQLKTVVEEINGLLPDYEQRSRLIFEHAAKGDAQGAAATLAANTKLINELNALTTEAGKIEVANVEDSRAAQVGRAKSTQSSMLSLVALAIAIGFALSFFISRNFSIPLAAAVALLEKLSKGDLTQRLTVSSKDEIGQLGGSLNRAMDSMDAALAEVGTSAKNLSHSSRQLARAAEALATGAQEQAASLQETSASLEEITATIRQNSDNAKHASQLAVSSRDSAEKGGKSATETVAAMAEIKSSSSKIAEIITTIDEIAFQTNLLSVNASVEAARAGVHGNGFKVVATEVRNLAQRSAAAAKEIKALINGSVRKVENGSTLVTNSGSTLKEIVSSVKRVSDIVGEIASASHEQATGIEQVGKAMVQMDQVTQANSSQTEELSATAASLASQSSHLDDLVSRFVLSSSVANLRPTRESVAKPAAGAPPRPTLRNVNTLQSASVSLPVEDGSLGLESMAKNVGQSFLSKTHDQEFEEF